MALAKVSMGRKRLPPAATRCAVSSGIRGACSEAMRSAIRVFTAANFGAKSAARLSFGCVMILADILRSFFHPSRQCEAA